jgi:hypothetical protein
MRKLLIIGAAALSLALLPSAASAKKIAIAGNLSSAQVKAACAESGGVYTEGSMGGLNTFACNTDCQGTGNDNIDTDHCNVNCVENSTPGNCQGWAPDKVAVPSSLNLKSFLKATTNKTN